MILTHYYHKDDCPFQNLSCLSEEEALRVISDMDNRTGLAYRRFKEPVGYLKQRRETESWLRHEFVQKGGQPASTYPHYFVVEQAIWIEEGYDGQSNKLQFPISAFSRKHVSFTYPDSMVSYWLRSQTDKVYCHPEYHGQVFTFDEIIKILDEFGIPSEEWRTEVNRKYDLFIEAQVWNSELAVLTPLGAKSRIVLR